MKTPKHTPFSKGRYRGRRFLVFPIVAGILLGATSMTPAAAQEQSGDSLVASLENERFSVSTSNGEELRLKEVSTSPAESILVGYNEKSGPAYVRTVSFFTGEPEKPLFDESGSTVPELDDPENEKVQEEFIPIDDVPEVNPDELKLGTVIAVNANAASLAWKAPENATGVTVLLDGKEAKASERGIELKGLEPASEHEVTVTFTSGSGDDLVSIREDTHTIQTLQEGIANPLESSDAANIVAAAASMKTAKAVRLVTFLKNNYYPSGWMGAAGCFTNPSWYFKGDNRGYSAPTGPTTVDTHPSYRTGLEVIAELQAPAAYQGIYTNKKVGLTKRYDANKNFIDSKRAANTGMVVQNPTKSVNNYVKFGVSHEIGDPYCWVGKIRYSLPLVQIYKSGTISLSGSRQPIPTFEFYGSFVRSNGTSHWLTLYRGAEGSLGCLTGGCISQNISKTASTT